MSWMSRPGSSSLATISRYLASDICPWPRIALAEVSSSCGRRTGGVRDVALAADRQQERVDARRVDGVDGVDAGQDGRDQGAGQLVDQLAERGVFLGRSADRGERPDGAGSVVDALDLEDREVVRQAVIAQVVAERPFGLAGVGVDGADDGEVGLGGDRQAAERVADHPDSMAAQGPGEAQLGQALGQRHHGGDGHRRRARRRRRWPGAAPLGGSPPSGGRRSPGGSGNAGRPRGPARTGSPRSGPGTSPGSTSPGRGGRGPRCRPAGG